MVTDAKCAENLAEVSKAKFQSQWARGRRGVLETSTAAETMVSREGTEIVSYLGPDRFDLQFATMEPAQDMQCPVGAAGVRSFFTYLDESGTLLAWADAAGAETK